MKLGKFAVVNPTWGDIPITKFKSFEYQFEFSKNNSLTQNPFEFSINWTTKHDHAGIHFTFSIYKLFWMNLNIHDCRHWDHQKDTWQQSE
jgi:hypothetical protein